VGDVLRFVKHRDLGNPYYTHWLSFLQRVDGEHSEAEIRTWQQLQAKRVLGVVYDRAPAYRRLYDEAGIQPGDFHELADLGRFPFLTKDMLRGDLDGFSVPGPEREIVYTGGSTGQPVAVYRDARSFARQLASRAHLYRRVGWREGVRQLTLRGLRVNAPDGMEWVDDLGELLCSTYHLVPERMAAYHKAAIDLDLRWLRCYPSSGTIFARYLEREGRRLPLDGVLCASERLYDWQKELMARVFGCRVFSHYGSYEMAPLAGYCESCDTYHVLPWTGVIELVDTDGQPITTPGEVGEIVATSFLATATPIIRYRTGDLARYGGEACESCGRPHRILESIEGRLQEFVVSEDGRRVSATALNDHGDLYRRLLRFQYYQEAPGVVTFRYVPDGTFVAADHLPELEERLQAKLGDIRLRTEQVDVLPTTRRGKVGRTVVQELGLSWFD